MARRYSVTGVVIAFVLGGIIGALVWDAVDDGSSAGGEPSTVPKVGRNSDLLDLVRAAETLPAVNDCRMVETFDSSPVTVRAFCSTASGDELRITYRNDPAPAAEDVAIFCDQLEGEGQGFIPDQMRWRVYQVAEGDPPNASLTEDLQELLRVEPTVCSD